MLYLERGYQKYITLDWHMSFNMANAENWKIDTLNLKGYKKNDWNDDQFWETVDRKYGVYAYNITEWRMLSYAGLIAVYNDWDSSKPIINSPTTWVWYDNENTFDYAPLSDCLIFRKPAYQENSTKADFPFMLLKPGEHLFGFLEWNFTSIYYGFDEVEKGKLILKEVHPKDLNNLSVPKRTNEIIDLNDIAWFDIGKLDRAMEIYQQ